MRLTGWFLTAVSALLAVQLAAVGPTVASHGDPPLDPEPPFVVCQDQTYALCATARCVVYNGIAYCECEVMRGNSISLQLDVATPHGTVNVCDVNAAGTANGFMVSTFSPPPDALKGGPLAIYTCPGTANAAGGVPAPVAYGQCDGGICFTSTTKWTLDAQLDLQTNITCACPISTAASPALGYQLFGPYEPTAPVGQRCQASGCAACSVPNPTANGSILPVGAPTGAGRFLTLRLTGSVPPSNECLCECPADGGPCTVREDTTP